jgi:hypothetical protein
MKIVTGVIYVLLVSWTTLMVLGIIKNLSDHDAPTVINNTITVTTTTSTAVLPLEYQNCDDVRRHGAAPLYRGQHGYSSKLDRDGDGIACNI